MVIGGVVIPAGHAEDLIGDEVFAGAVAFHDCRHHVLRDVGIVGEQLFRVFGEAIASVAEGGIVVVGADSRVKSYSLDNCF